MRGRTAEAALALLAARTIVAAVPYRRWQALLGLKTGSAGAPKAARRLGSHVDRAADRLPMAFKCLPRAIALSMLLRRRALSHRVVLAVRPASSRGQNDDLHAWVEVDNTIVIGELPGPWLEMIALPARL